MAVDGRLQVETYETKDGTKRLDVKVVAESIRYLDWPKKEDKDQDQYMGEAKYGEWNEIML